MRAYRLTVAYPSGDDARIAIRRREDIVRWVRKLDHDGAMWAVTQPVYEGHRQVRVEDLTAVITAEYRPIRCDPDAALLRWARGRTK
jgi:5,10-methylenetetrahydrofolate reductase